MSQIKSSQIKVLIIFWETKQNKQHLMLHSKTLFFHPSKKRSIRSYDSNTEYARSVSVLCTLIYTDLSDCTSAHTVQFSMICKVFLTWTAIFSSQGQKTQVLLYSCGVPGTFGTWTTNTCAYKSSGRLAAAVLC